MGPEQTGTLRREALTGGSAAGRQTGQGGETGGKPDASENAGTEAWKPHGGVSSREEAGIPGWEAQKDP